MNKDWCLGFVVFFALVGAALALIAYDAGWDARVHYEAVQCLDYGRCFH